MTDDSSWGALKAEYALRGIDIRTIHTSIRKTRPCEDGGYHKFADNRCTKCHDYRGEATYCWSYNCGVDADCRDGRWANEWPTYYELRWQGGKARTVWREDIGTCGWCVEKHRREDLKRQIDGRRSQRDYLEQIAYERRDRERAEQQQERERQWALARTERTEHLRQRRLLREGAATMRRVRRVLRGQEALPLPESTPAKSSQT